MYSTFQESISIIPSKIQYQCPNGEKNDPKQFHQESISISKWKEMEPIVPSRDQYQSFPSGQKNATQTSSIISNLKNAMRFPEPKTKRQGKHMKLKLLNTTNSKIQEKKPTSPMVTASCANRSDAATGVFSTDTATGCPAIYSECTTSPPI